MSLLTQIRTQNPLIHNITNIVSAHFSANGLLALGASPFMSSTPAEMTDVAAIADALVINMGGLTDNEINCMLTAGKAMNALGKPVVLDPVGAGVTLHRQTTTKRLLDEVQFSAIRGNAGEIAFLVGADWQSKGVDAGAGTADVASLAKLCANKYHTVVAVSGQTDYISDGTTTFALDNGTPLFPKITASGCLLACVCGAFLAVADKDNHLNAIVDACTAYAIAGELASLNLKETELGQFYVRLIDALASLHDDEIKARAVITQI